MTTVCTLCNSMEKLFPKCSCGQTMLDSGPAADYTGPYSPYCNLSFEDECCRHLFTCPSCQADKIISVPLSIVQ